MYDTSLLCMNIISWGIQAPRKSLMSSLGHELATTFIASGPQVRMWHLCWVCTAAHALPAISCASVRSACLVHPYHARSPADTPHIVPELASTPTARRSRTLAAQRDAAPSRPAPDQRVLVRHRDARFEPQRRGLCSDVLFFCLSTVVFVSQLCLLVPAPLSAASVAEPEMACRLHGVRSSQVSTMHDAFESQRQYNRSARWLQGIFKLQAVPYAMNYCSTTLVLLALLESRSRDCCPTN
jgi:hypothetical protein